MRHVPATLLAGVLAAALLSGCDQPFASARVEVPEIRIVQAPKDFPAPPSLGNITDPAYACTIIVPAAGHGCTGVDLGHDIGSDIPGFNEKGVKVQLYLTDLQLRLAAGGVSDLRSIIRAEVDLRDPSTGAPRRLASYARPANATPTTVAITGSSSLDLAPYLTAGKLDARVEVEVDQDPSYLPTGFTATFEAGFSVVVTADYFEML